MKEKGIGNVTSQARAFLIHAEACGYELHQIA